MKMMIVVMMIEDYDNNELNDNDKQVTQFFIQENTFENVVCKMFAILFRPQCVDGQQLLQGSHREASKNFNDFLMIFQDKNPKFPW